MLQELILESALKELHGERAVAGRQSTSGNIILPEFSMDWAEMTCHVLEILSGAMHAKQGLGHSCPAKAPLSLGEDSLPGPALPCRLFQPGMCQPHLNVVGRVPWTDRQRCHQLYFRPWHC